MILRCTRRALYSLRCASTAAASSPSSSAAPIETAANASEISKEIPSSSILPAGTPMKALHFVKSKAPPIAKENSEYPAWLWGLLEEKEVDLSKAKTKKRNAIKADNFARGSA